MPSPRIRGRARDDGTCEFEGVPGWDGYRIAGRAAIVKGKPCMVALTIEPVGDDAPALTGVRLKALPLAALALIALSVTNTSTAPDLRAAMRAVARVETVKHDPRAAVTVEAVAGVWRVAYEAGQPPRAAVVRELHIGARTADRYIARAREMGLLPPSDTKTPEPNPASGNRGGRPTTRGQGPMADYSERRAT